jgi:hypothetical protein
MAFWVKHIVGEIFEATYCGWRKTKETDAQAAVAKAMARPNVEFEKNHRTGRDEALCVVGSASLPAPSHELPNARTNTERPGSHGYT